MAKHLKAGSETGSIVNHVLSGAPSPEPEVGMGATIFHWTDRSAATVLAIHDRGRVIETRDDRATRTDRNGISESQTYVFTPDPNGRARFWKRNQAGSWRECQLSASGRWALVKGGTGIRLGHRDQYEDPTF